MHAEAGDRDNNWRNRPWSEADRAAQVAEMRRWTWTWRWGAHCPICLWPYGEFHLCPGGEPVSGPTDE
jgi:hypothetical protein